MTSTGAALRKPVECRYFSNHSLCAYGDECQFLHQNAVSIQQQPNFPNAFMNGSGIGHSNGHVSGQDSLGMGDIPGGGISDQFYNTPYSLGDNPGGEFQPFSRQRPVPVSRSQRIMGNPMMPGGPISQSNPMSQNSYVPFTSSQMPPKMPPNISPSPPLPPVSVMSSINGPVSQQQQQQNSLLNTMKPFYPSDNNGYDQLTNNIAAMNLLSNGKGTNPNVNEFIPKSVTLSHSASSPNFSTFNLQQSLSQACPGSTMSTNHIGGMNLPSVPSGASPNQSPRLTPNNSPLTMRRTGSPLAPLRQTTIPAKSGSATIQENVGGTTYFYTPEEFQYRNEGISFPSFAMYAGIPPHVAHMKIKSNMPQFFMSDELKLEILNRQALTMAQINPTTSDIPQEVDTYRNLVPLESTLSDSHPESRVFGYPTTCYKATSTKDGMVYCLRRINGFRLVNTKCMTLVDMWKKLYHPNVVQLREVFTTKAFGDHSIVFVYDFFAGAETLLSCHFKEQGAQMNGYDSSYHLDGSARLFNGGKGQNGPWQHAGLLAESLIWAYVVQLSSALRAIHAAGLSCRTLDPSKIILHSKARLRLNCVGIFDVLMFDSNQNNPLALTQHYQQEDLISLGKVVLALSCNKVSAIHRDNLQTSMELVARNYSADLKNLIFYLLSNQNRPRSVNDIMPMIGARFFTQLDTAQLRSDVMENELSKEVENGRLFRLLSKLGTISERPEFNMDPQWSETGDRYMIKLFRDYLFHQVDESGAPWIDMAHVVQCLNKLDAGVPEKISLMSRDEQNVLVVSYTELKQSFETAFNEILSNGHQSGLN
ncbi:hypothetical protein CHS0354_042055 [Potamilus streckersoni]|uniref:PAN2-PAN3 deadenylation complex subunit PAN3 n=1 Tax=Potamilus streckersoni TaxID=2493646 RepID=A0AAE0WAM3_9BIVA|nr:hypothetical protein CHS0354_042055 [Potamilus streckersoni]